MRGQLSQQIADDIRKVVTVAELGRVVNGPTAFGERTANMPGRLLLLAREASLDSVLEAALTSFPEEREPYLVDCLARSTREALWVIGEAIVSQYGTHLPPLAESDELYDTYLSIYRTLAMTPEQPWSYRRVLVITNLLPEAATTLLGSGRDKMWELDFPCLVVAAAEQREAYLRRGVLDSMFTGAVYFVD